MTDEKPGDEADYTQDVRMERIVAARVPLPFDRRLAIATRTHDATKAVIAVREWGSAAASAPADEPTAGVLVLLGGIGTGKTTAGAVAIANVDGARYVKSWRLGSIFANRARGLEMWDELVDAPLVVVDELGGEPEPEKDTPLAARALLELLDERVGEGLTLVLSNLSRKRFLALFDERALDRGREQVVIEELSGGSMRKGNPL